MNHEFDSPLNAWRQGGELVAQLVKTLQPRLTAKQIRPLAELLCSSPAYSDWNAEEQSPGSILKQQATIIAMAVQSLADRAQWACQECADPQALDNWETACRVINAAMQYLPGGCKSSAKEVQS